MWQQEAVNKLVVMLNTYSAMKLTSTSVYVMRVIS